jgi:hypothetical protein
VSTPCTSTDEGSTLSLLSFSEVTSPLSTHTLQTMCTPCTQKLKDEKKLKLLKCFIPSYNSLDQCTTCRSFLHKVFSSSMSVFSSTLTFPHNSKWSYLVHSFDSLNSLLIEFYRTFSSSISFLCLPLNNSSSSKVFSNLDSSP